MVVIKRLDVVPNATKEVLTEYARTMLSGLLIIVTYAAKENFCGNKEKPFLRMVDSSVTEPIIMSRKGVVHAIVMRVR